MRLLITGAVNRDEDFLLEIGKMGHSVIWMQNESDELPVNYKDVDGVICNGLFLHHPIEKFENLKYIQLTSAGYDRVPMEYIKANGIVIHNAHGVYSIPMAEYTLSCVLSVYNHSEYFRKNQSSHVWNKRRDIRELFGKRVCILGCGNVGTACAMRFEAMGCEVIGVDISQNKMQHYSRIYTIDELDTAISQSDILIVTLPLTEKTKHILNYENLSLMPNGGIVVNIARGGVLCTDGLINMLTERPDVVAVLDVFEEEPLPPDHSLWDLPNVFLTPHNSFAGEGNICRLCKKIMLNLKNSE